ncbi:acyl-CoA thioesterase [Geomonas anaerohicana]|uniref:Acyl-CoA thioesterase n=1 Tax=Geomonas anaerohicana TaxID=2798583 RepID=A0ABS0YB77_9BACT|nr:thioesterase family protein [Geomonas anaerohicana]MBJ6749525.1 acyl-CoA thioesterase [Geomonas anaerohicana]
MNDMFRYYMRVRYYECDAQKVVYNATYGNYVSVATTEFLRALEGRDLLHGDLDYKVVKQEMKWHAPARYDEVLEVSVAVKQLGRSSVTITTDFRIAGSPDVIASADTVRVLVDAQTMEKKGIPQDVREMLKAGAPGVVVDHAGYIDLDNIVFS